MSRIINSAYVPTYVSLQRRPVYVKYFDSKSVGAMYRILLANVWRADEDETRERGYVGKVFKQLATEYAEGNLVSYMTDEKLAELLMITERRVRTLRKQLEELGLIKAKKSEYGGWFYQVGELVKPEKYGSIHEVLFIDEWLAQVEYTKGDKNFIPPFELKLLELNKKNPEEIYGKKVEKAKMQSLFLANDGNKLPESRKSISKQEPKENDVQDDKNVQNSDHINTISKIETLSTKESYRFRGKDETNIRETRTSKKIPAKDGRGLVQPLFSDAVTEETPTEQHKNHLVTALQKNKPAKVRSTITKAVTELSYDAAVNIFKSAASEVFSVNFRGSSLTEIWEKLVNNKPGLVDVKNFIANWWVFYLLDKKKASVRFSIKKIYGVASNLQESVTNSTEEVIELIKIIRSTAKKSGSAITFADISHLYKALNTTKTYKDSNKANTKKQLSNKSVTKKEECPTGVYDSPELIKNLTEEEAIELIKNNQYTPTIMRYLDDKVRLNLWFKGYVNHLFMPVNAEEIAPKKCWEKATDFIVGTWRHNITTLIDLKTSLGEPRDVEELIPHGWRKLAMFMFVKDQRGKEYTYKEFMDEFGPAYAFDFITVDVPKEYSEYYSPENRVKILKELGNCREDLPDCANEENSV